MKAIVFDMDGILFDTERVGDRAWRQAVEEMQFAEIDAAIEDCRGLNRADTRAFFEAHFPHVNYPVFHKRNHEIMAELLADGMPIKIGAIELLQWLQDEKWRVALATSTGRESTMHHLESAQMTQYFDQIITGEQVQHGKPDPEIYAKACAAIGACPATTYAVEDSPNGIRSAAAAGLRVIMVPDLVPVSAEQMPFLTSVQPDLLEVMQWLKQSV